MKDTYLENLIGSALSAQEQQTVYEAEEVGSSKFSAITEKDGYIGEMVKASLNLFSSESQDFSRKFPAENIVILNSLDVEVAGTPLDVEFDLESFKSVRSILDYVLNISGLEKVNEFSVYWSNKKIHFEFNTSYGEAKAIVGVDVYREVDPNSVLELPQR